MGGQSAADGFLFALADLALPFFIGAALQGAYLAFYDRSFGSLAAETAESGVSAAPHSAGADSRGGNSSGGNIGAAPVSG